MGTNISPPISPHVEIEDLTPGQTILFRGALLTIISIHHRKGSLASLFVLSCWEGEQVVKLHVRIGSLVTLLSSSKD